MAYTNYFQSLYQTPQPPQPDIKWVQGEAGAKSYLVAPNQTVTLWDTESRTIYLKTADGMGMPSMKTLDYTIREEAQPVPKIPPQNGFATKDDLDSLREELRSLKAKFEEREVD